ncbi:MAG: hypothetical protein ACQXXC_10325, partial [Methanolinea tarda]
KEEDANFFKNWLRAQYAETIRETKAGAENEDWDIIGKSFHKWVKENSGKMGLCKSADYERFIKEYFPKFADIYITLKKNIHSHSTKSMNMSFTMRIGTSPSNTRSFCLQ